MARRATKGDEKPPRLRAGGTCCRGTCNISQHTQKSSQLPQNELKTVLCTDRVDSANHSKHGNGILYRPQILQKSGNIASPSAACPAGPAPPTGFFRAALCESLSRSLANKLPHLRIAERGALLLHRRRPVLPVGPHLAETAGNLRIAAREAFHELLPARHQSLRLF